VHKDKATRLNALFALSLILLATLFFIGGPDGYSLPSIRYGWNLGHTGFFIFSTLFLLHTQPDFCKTQPYRLLILITLVSLAIESIQLFSGRDFSLLDILRNLTGVTLTLAFFSKKQLNRYLVIFFSGYLIFDLAGFGNAILSDFIVQKKGPVIEDFENPATPSRWHGSLNRIKETATDNHVAEVTFPAGKYPGISFSSMKRNWSDYSRFTLRIFNPDHEEQTIAIRLNDIAHERSEQAHHDRFNQQIFLQPGWNDISFPLNDIKNSPRNRDMNLKQMSRMILFYNSLDEPKKLLLDDLILK